MEGPYCPDLSFDGSILFDLTSGRAQKTFLTRTGPYCPDSSFDRSILPYTLFEKVMTKKRV